MLTSSPDGVPVLEGKNVVRRRFVMTFGVAIVIGIIVLLMAGQGSNDRILGSGSTVAQPLIQSIAVHFQNERSGNNDWVAGSSGVEYEPIGSLGGIMRLRDPEVDFAIADYPLSPAALKELNAVQLPIVIGSISVAYNLGQPSAAPLRFSATTLAGIFSGRITQWDDPAITGENPGADLPSSKITVIHRSDGSGSTLNWSRYLARHDQSWKTQIGAGTTLKWPTGVGVKGSAAMAKGIKDRKGAIGYLETGQARRAGLSVAALQNEAGRFVMASEANVTAASHGLFTVTQAAEPTAYPVTAASYAIMKRQNMSRADNQRTLTFLSFLLDQGKEEARKLGYLPITGNAIANARQVLVRDLGLNTAVEAAN